jgi:hypothetical protein
VRKHQVELQVDTDVGAELTALISKKAKAPIQVSRTTFDSTRRVFVSECDVGVLTAAIREMVVDHSTFKRAIGNARRYLREGEPATPGTRHGCDPRTLEVIRAKVRAFLEGKQVDLCAVWRELACCCAGGKPGAGSGDDDWIDVKDPGLSFFVWPTVIDYTVDYRPSFTGQYGPFPFDDPWWKVLLIIIAIILTIAAWASSTADLANRSDDVVIGILTGSIMNPESSRPATPASTEPGSIDAAVVTLNGNRSLTAAVFSTLDAQSGEFFTATPIVALDAKIDTPGTFLTNAQIDAIVQNLADNPDDPAAQNAARVYKTGARSGIARGILRSVVPLAPRNDDGGIVWFLNQIHVEQDEDETDAMSCPGDSGSLWFHLDTHAVVGLNHASPGTGLEATANRIEDVVNQLGIRFA